ncbi:hypothetical protein FHG87_001513 [Trinorchestia longiramus]|nr:hypothetical protein FHG87_001513 [Trinorchestia longiramus]
MSWDSEDEGGSWSPAAQRHVVEQPLKITSSVWAVKTSSAGAEVLKVLSDTDTRAPLGIPSPLDCKCAVSAHAHQKTWPTTRSCATRRNYKHSLQEMRGSLPWLELFENESFGNAKMGSTTEESPEDRVLPPASVYVPDLSTQYYFATHVWGDGGADWTLPLTPWWASVLPVLARHHQEQQQQQQQQQQHSTLQNARAGFLQPPPPPTTPPKPILSNLPTMLNSDRLWPSSGRVNSHSSTSGGSQWSPSTGRGARMTNTTPVSLAGLDQVSLVTALGKEVSPQMVQALQAVATKRESFSSAAKLHCVSVTTLWRYFKKLNLQDPQKAIAIPTTTTTPPSFIP